MIIYWILFLVPIYNFIIFSRFKRAASVFLWFAVLILFSIVIGLRDRVGGDWYSYQDFFNDAQGQSLAAYLLLHSDFGYYTLNWVVATVGGSIYWVNLFCAFILTAGTIHFCRHQPSPWLAMLAAVPYMLIVVGMGYTRQATALGFVLAALVALDDGRMRRFITLVMLGALFHKTCVLLLPLAMLIMERRRAWIVIVIPVFVVLGYYLLLRDGGDDLWQNYVQAQMQSEGGAIRVAMNAVPAVLLLIFQKQLLALDKKKGLWIGLSLVAIGLVPLVHFASTAVDRMSLYIIPLQLYVFARLPRLGQNEYGRGLIVALCIIYYALVQVIWLTSASHAQYWVPYQFASL
jgi:hypothetical protein